MPRSVMRASDSADRPGRRSARTFMPKARAREATPRPMLPSPTMPRSVPLRPRAPLLMPFLSHWPARSAITPSGILRSMASMSPKASSATASALRPGTLVTTTPDAVAAATSMVLVPAPARTTRVRCLSGGQGLGGDLGAAHDEGLGVPDGRREGVAGEVGVDRAGVTGGLEGGDRRRARGRRRPGCAWRTSGFVGRAAAPLENDQRGSSVRAAASGWSTMWDTRSASPLHQERRIHPRCGNKLRRMTADSPTA